MSAPNSPARPSQRRSDSEVGPPDTSDDSRHDFYEDQSPSSPTGLGVGRFYGARHGLDENDETLTDNDPIGNSTFSSYLHTHDIAPPAQAAGGHPISHPRPDYVPPPIPVPDHPTASESLPPTSEVYLPIPHSDSGVRRGSDESEATLTDNDPVANVTLSSYRHTYDIAPPAQVAGGHTTSHPRPDYVPPPIPVPNELKKEYEEDETNMIDEDTASMDEDAHLVPADERRRGLFANIVHLHNADLYSDTSQDHLAAFGHDAHRVGRPWGARRMDPTVLEEETILDTDNPTISGARVPFHTALKETEDGVLRDMNHQQRNKQKTNMRIEIHKTSIYDRRLFILKLGKSLMLLGTPTHTVQSQLDSAARMLEIEAEFITLPGKLFCSFPDQRTGTVDNHSIVCHGRMCLGTLHEVHQAYRLVMHDEVSAKEGCVLLDEAMNAPPMCNLPIRCLLAFALGFLICPFAFAGSLVDALIAGAGSLTLALVRSSRGSASGSVFLEIVMVVIISFVARGLSCIRGDLFCYTAISSSAIVTILPGYLVLTSSLEMASKNLVSGSIKMIYALSYTFLIAFGLITGSDIFLLFNEPKRRELQAVADGLAGIVTLSGTFVADNTSPIINEFGTHMYSGRFLFSNMMPIVREHMNAGCYRPPNAPFYLRLWPWWTQCFIVPIFASISSVNNGQPPNTRAFLVMVAIATLAYTANKVADHFIFGQSEIVSFIGAFVTGLLGNIYSRQMGGTAFTSMVTGILFLVPSGLSESGGITAQGNGIKITYAMVMVAIGITVGLFMSEALVYTFGHKANAARFSL